MDGSPVWVLYASKSDVLLTFSANGPCFYSLSVFAANFFLVSLILK